MFKFFNIFIVNSLDIRLFKIILIGLTFGAISGCSSIFPSFWGGEDSKSSRLAFKLPIGETAIKKDQVKDIISNIRVLDESIGAYPLKVDNKELFYAKWSDTLKKARYYSKIKANNDPQALFFLAELYRQGHNLDVKGSYKEAEKSIDKCIDKFPAYLPCHISSAKYYLSIKPTDITLAKAELSLLKLREVPKQNLDNNLKNVKLSEDVEYNFVILRAAQGDSKLALKEINSFIKNFPDSTKVEKLLELKAEIKKNP